MWSTPGGHVYVTANYEGVTHRFPNGSLEFFPTPYRATAIWANEETLVLTAYGQALGFWRYDMSEGPVGSGAYLAAASQADLDALPSATTVQTNSPSFDTPACVDSMLLAGHSSTVSVTDRSERFSEPLSCMPIRRPARAILRAYGFRAEAHGTYQFRLESATADELYSGPGALALYSACNGNWMASGPLFEAALEANQQVVLFVTHPAASSPPQGEPSTFRVSVR